MKEANLEWDRLQIDFQYTPKVPKFAFIKLTSNHIHQIFGMITWGCGGIPLNVQTKLECNEDLAFVIQTTRIKYAKALKGT
jgi:hypothetical protein